MTDSLTNQVLSLARRPGGMANTDVVGIDAYKVGQCCSRLQRAGRIFCSRQDRRTARYYGTAEEARAAIKPDAPISRPFLSAQPDQHTIIDSKGRPADASRAKFTSITPPAGSLWAARCAPAIRLPSDRLPVMRPGSTEHAAHPSRSGGELRYRDGRIDRIEG